MSALRIFLAGLVAFLVGDFVWLGVLMRGFYREALAPIALTDATGALAPIWGAALLVYLLLVAGVQVFALPRGGGRLLPTAGWGAVFGVVTFGVYDLTNLATLRGFPPRLVVVDLLWGACVCAGVAVTMRLAEGQRPAVRTT
ncbi:MAG: DUF2177 family protein [Vicinamibacterales bacterium]